jgi:O-antigen ligase
MLAVFLAMAVGLHWPQDFSSYPVQKELRLFSLTALSAFAPFLLLQNKDERLTFVGVLALIGMVMAVLAAIDISIWGLSRRLGVFNTSVILLGRAAGFAALILFLLYWQRLINLWVFLPLVGLALLALLASGSRGPLLALLATVSVTLVLSLRVDRNRWWSLAKILVGFAGLAVAVVYFASNFGKLGRRFSRLVTGDWGSTENSRWALLQQTSDLISESPLGIGWGRLDEWIHVYNQGILQRYVHNIVLEIAVEAGWLAGAAFSILVVWTLAVVLRRAFESGASVGRFVSFDDYLLFAAPAYWLACALVSGDVNDNRPFWAMLGMALAVVGARQGTTMAGAACHGR